MTRISLTFRKRYKIIAYIGKVIIQLQILDPVNDGAGDPLEEAVDEQGDWFEKGFLLKHS